MCNTIQRFMKKHGYVNCFATHTALHDPKGTVADVNDFMKIHHDLLDKLVQDKRKRMFVKNVVLFDCCL